MRFTINPFTKRLDAFETDTPGFSDIETVTTDVGSAVGPDGTSNINIIGGAGIIGTGTPLTNTIAFKRTTYLLGTVTTTDATPTTCITFPMGSYPAVYAVKGQVSARNVTDAAGGCYNFKAAFRTTGSPAFTGVLIDTAYGDEFEEAAMEDSSCEIVLDTNSFVVQVTGILAKEIHWSAEVEYVIAL